VPLIVKIDGKIIKDVDKMVKVFYTKDDDNIKNPFGIIKESEIIVAPRD